ncbi:MAG: ATP-binding protein, partial [Clostridia bacterium]
MENLTNKKINYRFNIFTGIFIVVLLFTGIFSILLMREINEGITGVSENWLPSVIIAEELNTKTSDLRIAEVSHVISQDMVDMYLHEEIIRSTAIEITEMLNSYIDDYVTNEIDYALITEAESLWKQYLVVHAEMITYSRNNDTNSAMNLMENESLELFTEVSDTFLQLVYFNKAGADEARDISNTIFSRMVTILFLLTILVFFIIKKFKELIREISVAQARIKTAHKEALLTAEQLKYAHEEAILSTQAKSNFLANMSHEIRTPMNAISGMTDIILRESRDDEVSEYAQNIKNACDNLLAIINDVLDISKIESGKLEIVEDEYSLSNLLRDVLNITTNRLQDKPLIFITNFQHDLPDKLIGDSIRVKQIMVNLLNNAVKFTEAGNITFNLSGVYNNGSLELKFSVQDTGQGISQEDLDKIFVEFERINTTKNRSVEGTGLGLAISKRLCELMDGHIEIESEVDIGTTFSITIKQKYIEYIPIAHVETSKSVLIFEPRDLYRNSIEDACENLDLQNIKSCALQSQFSEALSETSYDYIFTSSMYLLKVEEKVSKSNANSKIVLLADNADIKNAYDHTTILLPANSISIANVVNGKSANGSITNSIETTHFTAPECNILIVDDNMVNIKVSQGLMKPYNFNIDTAENGAVAVEKIKNAHFDLVFMDHMMPIMDGIDATIAVRAMSEDYYQKLPIIALTANAIIGTREMFINEGMNDFLAKPIKINALHEILIKWLPNDKLIFASKDESSSQGEENELSENEVHNETATLQIHCIDTVRGLKSVGGNFDTYIEILKMYYADAHKRIPNIREAFEKESFTYIWYSF